MPSSTSEKLSKLDGVTFDALLTRDNPFGVDPCKLNLDGIELITPGGLVQLAALCHALSAKGRIPTITISDWNVRGYLERAGWFKIVKGACHVLPAGFESLWDNTRHLRGKNPLLLEATELRTGAALPELLDKIVDVFRDRLRYPKNDAYDVATAVSEIAQNTFDHNTSGCGYMAMQGYRKVTDPFVEIAIADCGEGLAATLRRNPKYRAVQNDINAINLSTTLRVSEYTDETRGTGLHHLLRIAYKHDGSVQIRSGSGKVRYRMDRKKGWGFPVAWMPGVQIVLTLKSKSAA
jgi:hypothetical protein